MPYRDPHTAAPALWALRHRDGCDFEVAVIEVPGTGPDRKALEATAITLYRIGSGRSPTASFGRMPAGYTISSGNNARLAAAGRRYRGGPDPAAPAGPASAPVSGLPGADPASADWMNWTWSPWAPISQARGSAAGTGLYRVRSSHHAGLVYVGQGTIALRLRTHAAKASEPATAKAPASPATWRHPGSHCPALRPSTCSSTRTISSPPTSSPQDTHRQHNSSDNQAPRRLVRAGTAADGPAPRTDTQT